jgi:hypothetical protein
LFLANLVERKNIDNYRLPEKNRNSLEYHTFAERSLSDKDKVFPSIYQMMQCHPLTLARFIRI